MVWGRRNSTVSIADTTIARSTSEVSVCGCECSRTLESFKYLQQKGGVAYGEMKSSMTLLRCKITDSVSQVTSASIPVGAVC